jgi:hypothetical protein
MEDIREFQGDLKARTHKETGKIARSIEKYGFSFPFFIWQNNGKNWCLDGHGRLDALRELKKMGYSIPPLPVVFVEAEDEAEAKNKLLRKNSQYGNMTYDSVIEFADGMDLVSEDLSLPTGKMVLAESMASMDSGRLEWENGKAPKLKIEVDIPASVVVRMGKNELLLSPEEGQLFENCLLAYVKENNGMYGFVTYLLGGE